MNETDSPARRNRLLARHPVFYVVLFEAMLGGVAVVLVWALGLWSWADLDFSAAAWVLGVAATVPLLVAAWWYSRAPYTWARNLRAWVQEHLLPMVEKAGPVGIIGISMAAGVAEELLFRGVIQAWAEPLLGPLGAVLLAALVFGLAHYASTAYFIAATLIGIYLGLLYWWTGNLVVPMLVHALYDWAVLQHLLSTSRQPRAGT